MLKRWLFHSVSGLWRLGTQGTQAVTDGISGDCGTNLKGLGVVLDNIPASENAGLQVEGPWIKLAGTTYLNVAPRKSASL